MLSFIIRLYQYFSGFQQYICHISYRYENIVEQIIWRLSADVILGHRKVNGKMVESTTTHARNSNPHKRTKVTSLAKSDLLDIRRTLAYPNSTDPESFYQKDILLTPVPK